jgi:hypothetical protein
MPPVRLTDSELDAVLAAARPLPVERRDAFLHKVASLLQGCDEIGPARIREIMTGIGPVAVSSCDALFLLLGHDRSQP